MNFASLRAWRCRVQAHMPRWVAILLWSGRDFDLDNGFVWATSIAYYGVLSVFPLALAGVAIASRFIDEQWAIQKASYLLGDFMPHAETIRRIIDKSVAGGEQTGFISGLFLLWTGGRVFAVLIRAVNTAWARDDGYGFWRRLLVVFGMLASIGLLFVGALICDLLAPLLDYVLSPIPHGQSYVFALLGWILPALLLLVGFYCLYKFVPRGRCNWQSALIAAAAAAGLSLGARPLFVTYVGKLAGYSHVYGWLAIGIVILIWAQIVAVITIYGAELASHIQMMAFEGMEGEEVSRRHRERSPRGPEGEGKTVAG